MQPAATFAPIAFGTNDVQIMAGSFDDVSFDDVIQVLGLSRQCLRLLVRRGEAAFSEVLLKAGQVLDARMLSSSDPSQVFVALNDNAVRGSGLSFTVYHTQPTGPFPSPRARLSELYARAKQPAAPAPAPMAPVADAPQPTLRLTPTELRAMVSPAQPAPPRPVAAPVDSIPSQKADYFQPTATYPALAPEALGKAVVAELQPVLRQELQAALAQLREHGQALHTLDGRLQALPQLVAAELRAALAQDRQRPAPAAPPPAAPGGLVLALVAGIVVLCAVVAALALRVLR